MGKSRYAKTKTAGESVGLSRYGKQFKDLSIIRRRKWAQMDN